MSESNNEKSQAKSQNDEKQEKSKASSATKREFDPNSSEHQETDEHPKSKKIRDMMRDRAQHPIQVQLYKKINQLTCDMRE